MTQSSGKNSGTSKRGRVENLKPFKKGQSGNPNGKPKGTRHIKTIYQAALKELAKKKKMTPEDLENLIEMTGIEKALSGEFAFFKDIRDRVHGQAIKTVDHTSGGKTIGEILDDLDA